MSIQAMNTSLKNNRKQIPKRDRFKNRLGGYNSDKKTEYHMPKATSKQLRDIRKRLQSQRKLRMIKVCSVTAILFFRLLIFIFSNFENASYYFRY